MLHGTLSNAQVGFELIQNIARKLYKETGLGPQDVQVIECHDCFAPNELLAYEALGLCPVGERIFFIAFILNARL